MQHADQVRVHSRWRQDWSSGRTAYAWLLPLTEQPGLRNLVNEYQYALRDLPGFDLVPLEWMHILLQEVGFTDELPESTVDDLLAAGRKSLNGIDPLTLSFHESVVLPEALALPAEPQATVQHLREALRSASESVLGSAIPAEPDETDRHVSLAHSTAEGPGVFAAAVLSGTGVEATTATVPAVTLVKLSRDHSSLEWEKAGEITLG
ncbi:hypothetical protein GIY23_06210 [Allosaccharopolyspora coralli]|uniref:2'-5' RNA ligase family protein n=1 Tax=Allosaccharopolyspora coralli TaxID=2665642 RepID=A0A5Q3QKN5_9PSEU|nr:2'-5' RNA ligase family protein [Allosaccharopolyspora coralli]QGK72085.1 hypothetical protein GIY23_06210 [Allosaccharopolyspora coralli]